MQVLPHFIIFNPYIPDTSVSGIESRVVSVATASLGFMLLFLHMTCLDTAFAIFLSRLSACYLFGTDWILVKHLSGTDWYWLGADWTLIGC